MEIPSNTKTKKQSSDEAIGKLRIIYNSGYFHYLIQLRKKYEKILNYFSKFIEKNVAIYGNKLNDLEYCESLVCFNEGNNISNIPSVYDTIYEKSKKMENLLQKLLDRINSRIYKTKEIKKKWNENYGELTAQDPVKIDYSIYSTDIIAGDIIFTDIFEIQKIGNEIALNPAVNT